VRDLSPPEKAHEARRYAEQVELESGPGNKRTIEAYEVAADAYEDIGATGTANAIRMKYVAAYTGRGYGYGISPPHGIFTKGTTMTYVKAMNRKTGSDYFSRESSRFFGGDKFYGPYVGPGGVFFVQVNKTGVKIKEVNTSWRINTYDIKPTSLDGARDWAKHLARTPART
jgi:hypothetical protein